MKSKDLQNRVLSKYKEGRSCTKMHEYLHGSMGLSTIEKWCKIIRNTGWIILFKPTGHPGTVRIEANIRMVRHWHDQLRVFLCRKIALDLRISRTSAQRILKDNLKLKSYKKKIQSKLSDNRKAKRLKFANWIRSIFPEEDTLGDFCFLTKSCSTSIEFITPETRESRYQVVRVLIQKIVPRNYRNFLKTLWPDLGYEYLLWWFSRRELLIMSGIYTKCSK